MTADRDALKRAAAEHAADRVTSGMVVGLGSGSTAAFAVRRLAERLRTGDLSAIVGVPCSAEIEHLARALGLPLVALDGRVAVDVTIDGADEIDPALRLIKGGGGALLREKMVAQASKREVIIADEAKLSPKLGTKHALPVEVVRFGWEAQMRWLEGLGARVTRRSGPDGAPFVTDEGHWLLDCAFGPLDDPAALARTLEGRAGVVEHGLFLGVATEVVVAGEAGVRVLTPS